MTSDDKPSAGSLDGLRVMVIDDSKTIRRTAETLLKREGADVVTAVDGFEALAKIADQRPQIIFVDIMMPRLDGVGMVETVRKGGDQTPVLFLSALGEVEDRVTGLKAGADDYLVKPYAFAELIARVCRMRCCAVRGPTRIQPAASPSTDP